MRAVITASACVSLLVACGTPAGSPTSSAPPPQPTASTAVAVDMPIALVSDADGGAGIYLASGGGERRRLTALETPAPFAFAPSWRPDGGAVAYHRLNAAGISEIHVVRAATGEDRLVAAVGPPSTTDPRLSWSPHGDQIAYWTTSGEDNEISVASVDSGEVTNITHDRAADRYPAWSPNGDLIAFWSDRSGRGALWLASLDGTDPAQLIEMGLAFAPAAWSPMGDRLAVPVEEPDDRWTTRIVAPSGGELARLSGDGSVLGAAFSPDGERIAYWQLVGQNRQLWVASADGSDARPIGPMPTVGVMLASHASARWPSPPSWSPEGDQVAVEWSSGESVEVLVVAIEDGGWASITPDGANDASPAWRPSPP